MMNNFKKTLMMVTKQRQQCRLVITSL
jgi:hypothetical protein